MSCSEQAASNAPRLGVKSAAFMVCASMIGTGVFTMLGFQAGNPFSPFDLLLLWVIGGAMALCGALAYGELSLRMPRSGGECRFLEEIYGPLAGFLAGWISIVVGFSASLAASAFALASYASPLIAMLMGESHAVEREVAAAAGGSAVYPQLALATAAAAIFGLTWVQRSRVEFAMKFQNAFVLMKIALIVSFVASAWTMASPQPISFMPTESLWSSLSHPGFAVSLVFVSFAYSGWNAAVYIAGDVRTPERTLPRALFAGTLLVSCLYVLLNGAFLLAAPREAFVGRPDVAFVAASRIWGPSGAIFVASAISIGLISSLSAQIWAGGSVAEALGANRPGFRWLGIKNKNGRPVWAGATISAIALFMLATSSFSAVIKLIGVLLSGCASLSVLGVFILDRRSAREGGRRAPLLVKAAAAVFIGAEAWILSFLIRQEPASCLAALATLIAGTGAYYLPRAYAAWKARRAAEATSAAPRSRPRPATQSSV